MPQDNKITCSKYTKQVGDSKRCVHFLQGGACSLPNELMCSEWLKVNQPREPDPPKQEKSQLFGFLGDQHSPCLTPNTPQDGPPTPASAPQASPTGPTGPSSPPGAQRPVNRPEDAAWAARAYGEQQAQQLRDVPLENMSLEAVESLSKLGVETQINTNSEIGEVWLVPDYTEQKRNELTYRDARFLMLVVKVFPGAVVKAVRKPE